MSNETFSDTLARRTASLRETAAAKPGIEACLQALMDGAWQRAGLPAQLYPHEEAQLVAYALEAAGYAFKMERRIFTVAGPVMQAKGTNSAMVYAYTLVDIPELPGVRLSLRGAKGEDDIMAEVLAGTQDPDAYIKGRKDGEWDAFHVPPLDEYTAIGRAYHLTAEQAKQVVAQGQAILQVMTLQGQTVDAGDGARKLRF